MQVVGGEAAFGLPGSPERRVEGFLWQVNLAFLECCIQAWASQAQVESYSFGVRGDSGGVNTDCESRKINIWEVEVSLQVPKGEEITYSVSICKVPSSYWR